MRKNFQCSIPCSESFANITSCQKTVCNVNKYLLILFKNIAKLYIYIFSLLLFTFYGKKKRKLLVRLWHLPLKSALIVDDCYGHE